MYVEIVCIDKTPTLLLLLPRLFHFLLHHLTPPNTTYNKLVHQPSKCLLRTTSRCNTRPRRLWMPPRPQSTLRQRKNRFASQLPRHVQYESLRFCRRLVNRSLKGPSWACVAVESSSTFAPASSAARCAKHAVLASTIVAAARQRYRVFENGTCLLRCHEIIPCCLRTPSVALRRRKSSHRCIAR
ncbi:uncharacterized protein K489DRAFT_181645 [Dissoconium aciculare CBS 342.82]|uniref:Uncharacterized protein n=1 Tax=Dissoconium aciculare CBS 342.82 TaxID=1314786 RepID=A0A6J3M961_9PEZI|nr:uncharacterized protein K489DRAFT_181645 [Dissoconium aciculare CBS 342.82]KAF1824398.1 hypothetical protein K489DRAFT_181645 [Dissoconium aciculare CBS 342.82]